MSQEQKPLWFDTSVTQGEILSVMKPGKWYSVGMIASRLNRNKRQLYKRLAQMTEAGTLEKKFRTLPNGVDMLLYRALL